MRSVIARFLASGLVLSAAGVAAAQTTDIPTATNVPAPAIQADAPAAPPAATADETPAAVPEKAASEQAVPGPVEPAAQTKPSYYIKDKKGKLVWTGPNTVVMLAPTPMLDGEGKQRIDPDGKPMFNQPVKQIRDSKGHPEFDAKGSPLFQTPSNPGYDEKGKKILIAKVKPPKMTPISISQGTLTVDGWTGKAELNYDIADLKFLYIYAPGIGITIVSHQSFPGAKEELKAFNDKTLDITVEGHPIELFSEKSLLGKKPETAWVAVDRDFKLPSKFPVFGYGSALKAPYAWPGAKQVTLAKGVAEPPPLPTELRPTMLLAPCPAGMMRKSAAATLPGQKVPDQPCVLIKSATPSASATAPPPANQIAERK